MGSLSSDLAGQLLGMRYAVDTVVPLNPTVARVYGDAIERNQTVKTDIWPGREVTLEPGRGLAPVVVGIWDSGVDTAVFGDQMWTNAAEAVDGADNDGNGFVDDVHGIAFDLDGVASSRAAAPPGRPAGQAGGGLRLHAGLRGPDQRRRQRGRRRGAQADVVHAPVRGGRLHDLPQLRRPLRPRHPRGRHRGARQSLRPGAGGPHHLRLPPDPAGHDRRDRPPHGRRLRAHGAVLPRRTACAA